MFSNDYDKHCSHICTSSTSTSLRSAGASSAKTQSTTSSRLCATRSSAAVVPADRKISSSAPLTNRTSRLVTITSYKSRSATTKPDEISGIC